MDQSKEKIISPKSDIVFQTLFGEVGSENTTKKFLETILNEKIDSIDLSKNPIIRKEHKTDKIGILDVVATLNENEPCNVEIQMENHPFLIERNLWYWSKRYSKQMQEGENYKKLHRTISILIINFNLEVSKGLGYHTKWQIIEEETRNVILTNKFEFHIINLVKIKEQKNMKEELLDWLYFLDDPNSERVAEKMKENKELKLAYEKWKQLMQDEKFVRMAELRQRAILDENTKLEVSYDNGVEEGLKTGEKRAKIEMAKKMIEEGMPLEKVIKIIGLTKEEILV